MRVGHIRTLCLCLSLFLLTTSRAQETQPSEYQLKSAFLFNFAKFVEWPPEAFSSSTAPLVFGVLGENPFGEHLENTVRNKTINGRKIVVKTVTSPDEAKTCHILFISTSERRRLREILEALRSSSVLTVGEMDRFIEAGGMINFVLENNKIRFQISDQAARNARLKISSKLLSLAWSPQG
jgi:hypothetical protein